MRNLTFAQWAYSMMALLMIGWTSSVFGLTTLAWINLILLLALTAERVLNALRVHREVE
jgi:hypothetical protein